MAYCSKCGAMVPDTARFCQKCGETQPATVAAAPAASAAQSGLSENAAALLSYVLGWITGIIFYLIDKRPYVRFHAAQSIITFGGLHILRAALGLAFGVGWWFGSYRHAAYFPVALPILGLLGLLTLVLWIVLMVKAYQGQRFKLPVAGDLAEDWARR